MKKTLTTIFAAVTMLIASFAAPTVYANTSPNPTLNAAECRTAGQALVTLNAEGGVTLFVFTAEEFFAKVGPARPDISTIGVYVKGEDVLAIAFDATGCAILDLPPLMTTVTVLTTQLGIIIASN